MNSTDQKINTWLPIFSGFYNTIWEFDDRYVLEYINESRENPIEYDNLEIDNTKYEHDISIKLCELFKDVLSDYIEEIEFEDIQSPKEYNYVNDSINCVITPKIDNIQKFIYKNKDVFCQYLKENYTSYDGFISAYENDFLSWESNTNNFTTFENSHSFGSILQFISEVLEIEEINMYYNIELDYLDYIDNLEKCLNSPICNKCNKFIEDKNILQDIQKYKDITKKYPSYILCIECLDNN